MQRVLPTITRPNSTPSFIVIGVLIIAAFVVVYYSYNFLYKSTGLPTAITLLPGAIDASTKYSGALPSVQLPYEGGDYTISFWLFVSSNTFINGQHRKHIFDIGGNNFSTVAIGMDAINNSLIVRTHTGTVAPTGNPGGWSGSAPITGGSGGGGGGGGGGGSGGGGGATAAAAAAAAAWRAAAAAAPGGGDNPGGAPMSTGNTTDTWDVSMWGGNNRYTSFEDFPYQMTNRSFVDSNGNLIPPWLFSLFNGSGSSGSARSWWNSSAYTTNSSTTTSETGCGAHDMWPCTGKCSSDEEPCKDSGDCMNPSDTCIQSSSRQGFRNREGFNTNSTPDCSQTTTLFKSDMASLFDSPVITPSTHCQPSPQCDLPEFDLQRWTQITVILSGKTVDVYMDGKLARSCIMSSYYKVDTVNVTPNILQHKTFDGKIANLNLYTVALNPAQVYQLYANGPQI